MQTVATISKQTKQGLSVFNFVKTAEGQLWMFGGIQAKAIQFKSISEMNTAIQTWTKSYGFCFGIAKATPKAAPKPITKKAFISDPWSSELPVGMQVQLEALSA